MGMCSNVHKSQPDHGSNLSPGTAKNEPHETFIIGSVQQHLHGTDAPWDIQLCFVQIAEEWFALRNQQNNIVARKNEKMVNTE